MPLSVQAQLRINVQVADEDVVFILRYPSAQEVSKFLNARFTNKRNKMVSRLYEARPEFIDSLLIDIENATWQNAAGDILPLNAQTTLTDDDKRYWSGILRINVESWKDLVNQSWKSSAAMYFEDTQSAAVDDGPEKN